MGAMSPENQSAIIQHSQYYNKYRSTIDRQSAYEILKNGFSLDNLSNSQTDKNNQNLNNDADNQQNKNSGGLLDFFSSIFFGSKGPKGGQHDGIAQQLAKSATRQVVNQISRKITRGILGGFKK